MTQGDPRARLGDIRGPLREGRRGSDRRGPLGGENWVVT